MTVNEPQQVECSSIKCKNATSGAAAGVHLAQDTTSKNLS